MADSERSKLFDVSLVVLGSFVLAICAGLIVNALSGKSGSGSTPPANMNTMSPTPTPSGPADSPTATLSSGAISSSQPKGSSSASPATSPLSTHVAIVAPVNDPGFSPVWNGTTTIDDVGLIINSAGVSTGSAQDWDLAYQSNAAFSGYIVNGNTSEDPAIFEYQGSGTPNPEWCRREMTSGNPLPTPPAQPGDMACYVDQNGMVGYLEVISVGANGPTVAAWFWKGPSLT